METSIFVTDLAQQFSISLVGSSLSGWPEQAGANFLILSLSFPSLEGRHAIGQQAKRILAATNAVAQRPRRTQ
jgi:hypothetical protein